MAEHEPCIGLSSEWFTPPSIFEVLGLEFDLDPCSPGPGHWIYTVEDDGLAQPWDGLVFMNPPFGGRNGHVPWLKRFLEHGNGIAIVRAYTSSAWFNENAVRAELMLFPRGCDVANDALNASALGWWATPQTATAHKGIS
jgi:hypothetical protein